MRLSNPTGSALQPADNWSGMYFGASFGAGVTSSRGMSVEGSTTVISNRGNANGALIDLFFGINRQLGSRVVVGGQVEGSISEVDFRHLTHDAGLPTLFNENSLNSDWMASAIARAGFLVTPSTLLYGLAGWTHADVDADRLQNSTITGFSMDGVTVGGGFERSISPDWTVRGEYRFTDFDEGGDRAQNNKFALDGDMHIGRIGVARKLGRSEPSAEALK